MKSSATDLVQCERALSYKFSDRKLLKRALTHASAADARIESNERLEFLGDSVLELVVSNLLRSRFLQMNEGELSTIRGRIVSRKTCRKVAIHIGLDRFLITGHGLNVLPDSVVANAMESVIGAIFLDGGYEEARLFVEEFFIPELEEFFSPSDKRDEHGKEVEKDRLENLDGNYKAILQTRVQREKRSSELPRYLLLAEKGPSHRRRFKIAARLGERVFQAAWGSNKKEAEQRAAENALYQLEGSEPPHISEE